MRACHQTQTVRFTDAEVAGLSCFERHRVKEHKDHRSKDLRRRTHGSVICVTQITGTGQYNVDLSVT